MPSLLSVSHLAARPCYRDNARARAAGAKGCTLVAFALWVLGSTVWHAFYGTLPRAAVMGVVGVAALIANGGVVLMLYRFRRGDANMRSVWICSLNDAIGNAAVLLAAMGVFGTETGWPDIVVATIMGVLGVWADGRLSVKHGASFMPNAPLGVAAE